MSDQQHIAIIGAGLAGITSALKLNDNAKVTLFEKSHTVSGRLATRTVGDFEFDHGAQFFTAKSVEFQSFIQPLIDNHIVDHWDPVFVEFDHDHIALERQWNDEYPHFVAKPKMRAMVEYLSERLIIKKHTRICNIVRTNNQWSLIDDQDQHYKGFDWVILAMPAEQASALTPSDCAFSEHVANIRMLPCYSLMLGFDHPLNLSWQAACVTNANLSWISQNHHKPDRKKNTSLIALATNKWSEQHIENDYDWVIQEMLNELENIIGPQSKAYQAIDLQRWRYANANKVDGPPAYLDHKIQLAAIGDWCIQGRVENAFLSGAHCARAINQSIS